MTHESLADALEEYRGACMLETWETKALAAVYDTTDYAWEPTRAYLERFGSARGREALLLGMNPGPWGMAQTGVPFGDVVAVRDWMGIEEPVGTPEQELEKRRVEGFSLTRREGSGKRLWGWAEERFGTPERFFQTFFVWNYCPLLFLDETNCRNRTPDKLYKADREKVYPTCDAVLRAIVEHVEPRWIIGVGVFGEKRARAAFPDAEERGLSIGSILHPSPANPRANGGWAPQAEAQLDALGVRWRPE